MIRFVLRFFAGAVLLLSAQVAIAQQQAASTPGQVMSQYPNGGPDLVTQVQNLMNADRGNLAAILAFAQTATEDQRKAIGQGLAAVAKSYAASDPGYVTQIAQAVANAGLPELEKAYAEAASDTGTAATGGGGGGGAGPTTAGPPSGGSNNGANPVGTTFAVTQSSSLTSSGGGGSFGCINCQNSPF